MKKILSLLLVFTSLGVYAQKTQIRLNLQKDSTYYLTASIKMDIDEDIQGNHQRIKTVLKGTTAHKIVSIQDTLYYMSVVYKNFSMGFTINGREVEMGSEGDTSNILSKVLKGMVDQPFDMVLSKRGQVIDVTNFDKVFTNAFAGLHIPEERKQQVEAQLRQSFSGKSIRENMQQSFIIYAKRAVGLKDVWTDQSSLEVAAISAKIKNTYTLDAINDDTYEIGAKSLILPDKAATFKQTAGTYMRMLNIGGKTDQSAKINKTTGWVNEVKTVKHITCNAEVKKTLESKDALIFPMIIDAVIESSGK